MASTRLLWAQLFTALLVAILHIAALQWDLYFYYYWFDMVTHTIGGIFIALAAASVAVHFGMRISVPFCIFIALIIGLGWEVFEYVFHIPQTNWISYPLDTAKDIVMDTFGGTIGACIARYIASHDRIIVQ